MHVCQIMDYSITLKYLQQLKGAGVSAQNNYNNSNNRLLPQSCCLSKSVDNGGSKESRFLTKLMVLL